VVTIHWGKEKKQERVVWITWKKYSEEQLDQVFCSAGVSENYKTYMH
jgi:hypothetical protein